MDSIGPATDTRVARPAPWWGNLPLPEPHLAALAIGAILDRRRPWRLRTPAAGRMAVGCPLLGIGAGLVAASWAAAGRTDLGHPDRLVLSGPYRHTRNPMYLGWMLLHLGTSLVAGSRWMLVGLPVAVAVIHRQVLDEERVLAASFGDAFDSYRLSVPRYVGVSGVAWHGWSEAVERRGAVAPGGGATWR